MPHPKFHISGKYGKDPLLIHSWQIWQMCIVIHWLQIWHFPAQYMQRSGCVHYRGFRDDAAMEMLMPPDEYVSVAKVPDICRLQRWRWWHGIYCAICGGCRRWRRGWEDEWMEPPCYHMVWCSIVWYGVVWCGMVWYLMLLCGVEDEWMEPPKPLIMGEGGCNTTVG